MNKLSTLSIITASLSLGMLIGYNANTSEIKAVESVGNVAEVNLPCDSQTALYDEIMGDIDTIEMYNTSELTEEILANRNGKIIIEKVVGIVENNNLDGSILNNGNKGNYISYKNVDGVKKGDTVLTYFIYNPLTNVIDDVMTRVDFIVDGNTI